MIVTSTSLNTTLPEEFYYRQHCSNSESKAMPFWMQFTTVPYKGQRRTLLFLAATGGETFLYSLKEGKHKNIFSPCSLLK